jgi:hypothetical protein
MECSLEANKIKCCCTSLACKRRGKCCECITHHLNREQLPACAFPAEVEKTYDRSFARFVQVFQEKSGKNI